MLKRLIPLLLLPFMTLAQTQHDRIKGRGASTFDQYSNTQTLSMTGATPSIAGGNVFKTNNGSTTTVTNFLNGVDSQQIVVICGDANTTIANNANIVITGGSPFVCGVNASISFVFNSSSSVWSQVGGSGGGGGGGSPAAPANSLQKNSGSNTFAASKVTDDGTNMSVSENSVFKGPNPYTDVSLFGARALFISQIPAVPGLTASTTNGNNQVTVSTNTCPSQPQVSNVCFIQGDGVTIYNVGPAITMTTPSAPTVTPSQAVAGTGTGRVVTAPTGATTFNYRVLACDINLGCTASSPTGTTTTGNALGAQNIAVSSITRALDTLTFHTASQPNISVGTVVHVDGCSNADNLNGFCGWFKVSTVTGTGFTSAQTGLTTVNGAATTSAGSGTANWWNANHVSWTGQPGVFRYVIQSDRQSPGTFVNIGMSWAINPVPALTSVFTDGTLTFDDFGQTMMARSAASIPGYVPTNGSATNDALTTTVTNVSGTTLTLAAAPSQNLSGQTILFDDAPTELAAISAAPSAVWFAVPGVGTGYVTNSILNLTGAGLTKTMLFPAGAFFNDTVVTGNNPNWYGYQMGTPGTTTSFQPKSVPQIAFASTPGLFIATGNGGEINSLQFNGAANGIAVQQDGGGGNLGTSYNFINFLGAGLSTDYMSMGFLCRGQSGQASCLSKMGTVLIEAGTQSMTDTSFTPSAYWDDDGDSTISNLMGSARGMQVRGDSAGSQLTIGGYHWQANTSPIVTVSNTGSVLIQLGTLGESIVDTGSNAVVFNVGDSNQQVLVSCGANLLGCGAPSAGVLTLTGQAVKFSTGNISGQNTNAIVNSNFTDNAVSVIGIGAFGYQMLLPLAPASCAVSAGGSAPIGALSYQLTAVDINGNTTTVGPACSATTSSGNQTVTITTPATPTVGAVNYNLYRNGAFVKNFGGTCGLTGSFAGAGAGLTYVDTGVACGQSAPSVNRAAVSSIGSSGLSSTQFGLVGGGFESTVSGNFTANRTVTMPDASGSVCLSGSCSVNAITVGSDAAFSSSPREPFNALLSGALTTTWVGETWTIDKGITVTRIQAQAKTAPSGCSTNAVVQLSNGLSPLTLTITGAANDSGAISQNYSTNAILSLSVQTAAAGCTTSPGDVNVVVQYRMQ